MHVDNPVEEDGQVKSGIHRGFNRLSTLCNLKSKSMQLYFRFCSYILAIYWSYNNIGAIYWSYNNIGAIYWSYNNIGAIYTYVIYLDGMTDTVELSSRL